jgi:hypothetical protein
MTEQRLRPEAYLDAMIRGRHVLARAVRERRATPFHTTLAAAIRSTWIVVILVACGGRQHGDTYAKATSAEQACCEHLTGTTRDQCLHRIVRIQDPAVASSSTNQATYACVEEHFVCDPQTGHATQVSAQDQMDCVQDLR